MELNLQPASVVKREALTRRRPFLVLASLSLLALLAGFWLFTDRAAKVTAAVTEGITPEVNQLKGLETKMKSARKEIDTLVEQSAPLLQAAEDRHYWLKVIDDINNRLPKEFVWITNFETTVITPKPAPVTSRKKGAPPEKPPEPRAVVQLRGYYLHNDKQAGVVDEFVEKLDQSELYEVLKKEADGFIRAVPNEADWAYEFAIPLALKKPIALPDTKQ